MTSPFLHSTSSKEGGIKINIDKKYLDIIVNFCYSRKVYLLDVCIKRMKRIYKILALDFYGELLSRKKLEVVRLYYYDDLGLTEIAEVMKISRQAVFDAVHSSNVLLQKYERKLGLVKYYLKQRGLKTRITKMITRMLKKSEIKPFKKKINGIQRCLDKMLIL